MSLYDGFFDATIIETLEDGTEVYDRTYDAADFTGYLEEIIGSGVCVYNNPDSFLVRLENGSAVVAPGYLFIRGYWLRNTADYPLTIESGTGRYAILAHFNMSGRKMELMVAPVENSYFDSLVLAIVDAAAGTIQDTRPNDDLCGLIDGVDSLSKKVKWAVDYIDTQVESKLEEAEDAVKEQADALDAKIAEVSALAEELSPPPIGAIKFSASQTMDPEWLLCDGSFISKANYPELVALLGSYYPSGDKFQLLSSGEVGAGITNGALYGGRMWFYSFPQKKLYGVDVEGTSPIKSISVSSTHAKFGSFLAPSNAKPLVLSIVPHLSGTGAALFLSQIINQSSAIGHPDGNNWMDALLLFGCEFSGTESTLALSPPFSTIEEKLESYGSQGNKYQVYIGYSPNEFIPSVVSHLVNGVETYYCAVGYRINAYGGNCLVSGPSWHSGDTEAAITEGGMAYDNFNPSGFGYFRSGYSKKSKKEVIRISPGSGTGSYGYYVSSFPSGLFTGYGDKYKWTFDRGAYCPLTVVGANKATGSFSADKFPQFPLGTGTAYLAEATLTIPSAARNFVDAGAYLWGKDIFMIFVGTGLIFSRTLEAGSFGYLDTTGVLGTITQFGYLDYSEDEGTLYIAGQDSANKVKVAKMELDTLFDYASDGAWLPNMNMDGIPAYIKAKEPEAET